MRLQTESFSSQNRSSHFQVRSAHLRVGVVGVPGGPERVLSAEVPHDEVNVLPHDLLHVGPDRRGSVHHLVHQELVEDCRLARVVQTNDTDLVLWNGEKETSACFLWRVTNE